MERQRREQMEMMDETESLGGGRRSTKKYTTGSTNSKMSRSMIHLAGDGAPRPKYNLGGGISTSFLPLGSGSRNACSHSGTVTPGGHINNSRPGGAMSTSTTMSTSGFINRRSVPAVRKPRPASIAGISYFKGHNSKTLSKTASSDRLNKLSKEKSKDLLTKSAITPPVANRTTAKEPTKSKEEKEAINQVKTEITGNALPQEICQNATEEPIAYTDPATRQQEGSVRELAPATFDSNNDAMTASMIAKSKITTEEEAKAALAERRRLAREEAERQAEMERQRIEAERLAELKKQEEEAERQRQFEEEAIRLAAEQRKAEEERLRQAIEEATQREEEERRKRKEEEKQRIEREEAERKAKEEAEKQRIRSCRTTQA
ncbi:Reticulocyte-binding protein 2 homolog a [Eumeta japonica]|uniref:Reticulocyte-binding protein 2 homolog a n=1 Tax=Eumeta variegata TaxID=151549 RepID=A0A4C2AAC1_EUMVA|nr:Reticulocyte-binding protein 2 homolog a [Eumeta japonica]